MGRIDENGEKKTKFIYFSLSIVLTIGLYRERFLFVTLSHAVYMCPSIAGLFLYKSE